MLHQLDIEEINAMEPTIFVAITGWKDKHNLNVPFFFKAPYSSHSNYRELETFVKGICPRNLVFNVDDRAITKQRLDFQAYLMKSYIMKDSSTSFQATVELNDPLHGFARRTLNSKQHVSNPTEKDQP